MQYKEDKYTVYFFSLALVAGYSPCRKIKIC